MLDCKSALCDNQVVYRNVPLSAQGLLYTIPYTYTYSVLIRLIQGRPTLYGPGVGVETSPHSQILHSEINHKKVEAVAHFDLVACN